MKNEDLARKLWALAEPAQMARPMVWQDRQALREAARKIGAMADAETQRVLHYSEIVRLPAGALVWEECMDTADPDEDGALPVIRIGAALVGTGGYTMIVPEMGRRSLNTLSGDGDFIQYRWWTARPTDEQRAAEAWRDDDED